MKILIDQNISSRLEARLKPIFPAIEHVKSVELIDASDQRIFHFARNSAFVAVITQDEDFYHLLIQNGPPPKLIWLRTGNCSTAFLTSLLTREADTIRLFLADEGQDCLEIYG